jgi:hypothetical protein
MEHVSHSLCNATDSRLFSPIAQSLMEGDASFSVSDHVKGLVDAKTIWTALLHDTADTKAVSFEHHGARVYHPDSFFHPILGSKVAKTRMLLLFPHDQHVIDTWRTPGLARINRELNEHLGPDPAQVQVVLCVRDWRYKIRGVRGKLYLQWADTLCIYQRNTKTDWTNMPLLVATDGTFGQWAAFPVFGLVTDRCFIAKERIKYVMPRNYVMFSCDAQPLVPDPDHAALNASAVANLAERDLVPDHELPKYQMDGLRQAGPGAETPSLSSADREARTDDDDDDSGMSVFISDMPTPRWGPLPEDPVQTAMMREFFGDASAPSAAGMTVPDDFQLPTAIGGRAPASSLTVIRFAAPQDSASRREAKTKLRDGAE